MYEIEVTTPPMEALDNDALAIIFSFLDDVSKFRLRATCSRMRLLGDELCTVLSVSLPDSIRFDLYMMKHLPFLSRLPNLRGFRIPETPYLVPECGSTTVGDVPCALPLLCSEWRRQSGSPTREFGSPQLEPAMPPMTFSTFCFRVYNKKNQKRMELEGWGKTYWLKHYHPSHSPPGAFPGRDGSQSFYQ